MVILVGLLLVVGCGTPHEFAGTLLSEPQPAPDFELISADGPVQLSDYQGQYVYLYFGYTFCPDICPTTLATLKNVRAELGEDADKMQVLMVSVDPERDTPDQLATYMGYFDESFVGVTGEQSAIDAAGEPFGVYYERHEGSAASGYLIDHTARFYLVDPNGDARVAYPHSTTYEQVLNDLNYLIANES